MGAGADQSGVVRRGLEAISMVEGISNEPDFDPLYQWLGIPPVEQPPTLYRLLGLSLFESNPDVIEQGADRQMAHVRTHQGGTHSKVSQMLLNQLASAKLTLLNPTEKAAYDQRLSLPTAAARREPAPASPLPTAAPPSADDALKETFVAPWQERERTKAVYRRWLLRLACVAAGVVLICFTAYLTSRQPAGLSGKKAEVMRRDSQAAVESHPSTVRTDQPKTPPTRVPAPKAPIVKVAGMHPVPFKIPAPGITPSGFPERALRFRWDVVPTAVDIKLGAAKISVERGGAVFIEATWEYEGNKRGGWYEQRLTRSRLLATGWTSLGPCPWASKSELFRKEFRDGETASIRTNKYWPPFVYVAAAQ